MDTDTDELQPRNGRHRPLPADASQEEQTIAINTLVRAVDTLAVELQLNREALREQGIRFETSLQRIEKAVGVIRERETIPPPKPEDA